MDEKDLKIPQHVAIIMDGNGRWAKKKHRPRTFGHAKGAKVLEQTLEDADSLGVKYFTVYAFSTENWARPYEEVQIIMNLFRDYLISAVDKCNRNNVRCMVIGERTRLDADIIDAINNLEEKTKNNTGITFIVAINYGSRDEITRPGSEGRKAGSGRDQRRNDLVSSGYQGNTGSGSPDPYQRRRKTIQFSDVAASLYGVLLYGYSMAGF